ncbi:diguanylate cyclase [candidate division CSSED10-310 bacterium]|uniref:Diguanylate cyclase n=1 Tax=candidate division CSSED10-310 bacterium TaxID=2855610 RepID=A0ABV6YWK6_UNCC1
MKTLTDIIEHKSVAFFFTPIPIRNVFPFFAYILLFTGFTELITHYNWLGICWTIFLLVGVIYWLILNVKNEVSDFFDQFALVQFHLSVIGLAFILISDPLLMLVLYFFIMILITLPFSRRVIQYASIELMTILFFQTHFLPSSPLRADYTITVIVVVAFGLAGFLLSYLKDLDPSSDPKPDEDESGTLDHLVSLTDSSTSSTQLTRLNREQIYAENKDETKSRIKAILEMVYDILKPYNTIYFELKRDFGYLIPVAIVGDAENVRHDITIEIGKGPIGWVAKNALPFNWNRSSREGDPDYYRQRIGIQSLLAVPILDAHFLCGILVIDSDNPNAFTANDQKVMEVFARQIALMFEVQNLAFSKQLEAEEFKILHHSGNRLIKSLKMTELLDEIGLQLREIIDFQSGLFLIHNEKTGKLDVVKEMDPLTESVLNKSFDLMEGLVGWVFQNQQEPVIFGEARKVLANQPLLGYGEPDIPAKALLFLPLYSPNRPLAIILLLSTRNQTFQGLSGQHLSILTNQYSLAFINARMYQQLEQLAVTDGLTQLTNHRYFQECLSNEFKRMKRTLNPLSLIMIDIDYFKKVNDQFGHPAGDQVLIRVAQIIKSACREIDYVARYGGEEFAVLLINTGKEGALLTAERIRQTVAQEAIIIDQHSLKVSVSLGVASSPEDCDQKQQLIDLADQALYQAKKSGRNRVVQIENTTPLE